MAEYSIRFDIDYPDRELDRLTTFFRPLAAIPIIIVFLMIAGSRWGASEGGLLFLGPLLMIVFRQKYPRWWFDWNVSLLRFANRIGAYLALLDDRYPATDDEQSIHLDIDYPAVKEDLNRWFPLIKWLLAIPHYIVLSLLYMAGAVAILLAWFSILITGRYPRSLFDFVVGVLRWNNRVVGYAFLLVTDQYPPFSLR